MAAPLLVMVAGPNGSGKSTLTQALQADPEVRLPALYINADDLQREQGLDAATAQRAASHLRARAIAEARDFMYETVMSHPSKVAELQQARSAGYEIAVHFVSTEDPTINVQRVALRVSAGGHDVPEDRTRKRYGRTMALVPVALGFAQQGLVFDNSKRGAEGGLQLQAQLVGSRLELMTDKPARWVEDLAMSVNERVEESTRLQQDALDLGLQLTRARLDDSQTEGRIERLGTYHAAQFDLNAKALVLHERALFDAAVAVTLGRTYRIGYRAGVCTVKRTSLPRRKARGPT